MATAAKADGWSNRKYWRNQRIRVNGRLVAPLSEEYHGRKSTYDYYGCHCDLCTQAAREARRRQVAQQPVRPPPQDAPQDEHDDHDTAVLPPMFLEPVPSPREPTPDVAPEEDTRDGALEEPAPEAHSRSERDAALAAVPDLGAEVPEITPGARAEITTVDQLRAVVEAYHRPQWTAPFPGDPKVEKRSAQGVLIRVSMDTGAVVFVGEAEQSTAAPETLREPSTPKSTKRGGGGSTMPTSYDELAERLVALGCTVDRSGGRHVTVILPDGRRRSLPRKSGDWRGVRNAVSQFKADGLDVRRGH